MRRIGAVDGFFRGDEQARQRFVGLAPGGDHLVGGGIAEHLLHGAQQVVADDRVVLRQHAQRGVLLDDAGQGAGDRFEPVDVRAVRDDRPRQRARLRAGRLVRLVEEGLHLRMALEHDLVEVAGDGLAVGLERGHGGLDDGDGLRVHGLAVLRLRCVGHLTIRASRKTVASA
ncbi:hypothetical protein D9M69_590940 [compost metagenome]